MAKITYLLGAGASCNALPIINQFPEAILYVLNSLKSYEKDSPLQLLQYFHHAIQDLEKLYEGCENHQSVDTYAKMLYLTSHHKEREEQYRVTKSTIVLFFEIYRLLTKSFDKRYDAFFATVLEKEKPRLPQNINIISWNYDYEFEKAFMNYNPELSDIHEQYEELNVLHKNILNSRVTSDFSILKINGTVGYYDENKKIQLGLKSLHDTKSKNVNAESVGIILREYHELTHRSLKSKYSCAISFSWEKNNENELRSVIRNMLKDTEILVVIGYSFPYFNREIDSYIFECYNPQQYRTLYVQDPHSDNIIETIKGYKRSLQHILLTGINNTNQFFIPHQL
jgi:hypothetical protein